MRSTADVIHDSRGSASPSLPEFRFEDETYEPPVRVRASLLRRLLPRNRFLRNSFLLAVLAILILNIYPMIWLLWGSVEKSGDGASMLGNYAAVFSQSGPLSAMMNTVIFIGGSVFLGLVLALFVAVTTTRFRTPLSGIVRLLSSVALVTPSWLLAFAYLDLLAPNSGIVNNWFDSALGIRPFDAFSMPTMILVGAFSVFPYFFLAVQAALENVDSSYEQAAQVCGASPGLTIRRITLPLVSPVIITLTAFTVVILGSSFGIPAILGSPAGISVLATYLYYLVTSVPVQLEFAAAIAVIFAIGGGAVFMGILNLARRGKGGRFQVIAGKAQTRLYLPAGRLTRVTFASVNCVIVLLAVVVPYLVIVRLAITKSPYLPFGLSNITFSHFTAAFAVPGVPQNILNSLLITAVVAVGAMSLGFIIGYMDVRVPSRLQRWLSSGATFPQVVPVAAFVIGVAWAWLQPPVALYGTLLIIMLGSMSRHLPLATQQLRDGVNQLHFELEDAGRVCGATSSTVLRKITLPLLGPVGWATLLLIVMGTMGELITPIFLGDGTDKTVTLAVRIFLIWSDGNQGTSSVLILVLMAIIATFYGLVTLLQRSTRRRILS